jgi:hypothetical protein
MSVKCGVAQTLPITLFTYVFGIFPISINDGSMLVCFHLIVLIYI